MEKLIELLNEYEKESNLKSEIFWEKSEFIVISKKFWFIKWLVENDKIDRNLVDWAILHKTHRLFEDDYWVENMNKQYYEKTLMLLSISDTPIDDLISYLK